MPLYFFHLSFGNRVVPDEEGFEVAEPVGGPRRGVDGRARAGPSQERGERRFTPLGGVVPRSGG
jgi:hypothetical protein